MIFYVGLHKINHAYAFDSCFISVNRLRCRKSDFTVNNWIMDSGAFVELSQYGYYRNSPEEYAHLIERWKNCGNLEMAVAQDYMCEPVITKKTGLNVTEHQRLTIQRYDELLRLTVVPILPVLQGYQIEDYIKHLHMYGNRLEKNMRVGVGSICKRNKRPEEVIEILEAIKKERPDLKLHGFGIKITCLKVVYIQDLLYSADSMAWSYTARMNGRDANSLDEALIFKNKINMLLSRKSGGEDAS